MGFHRGGDLVTAAIPEHACGKPIELWWQDETRVGPVRVMADQVRGARGEVSAEDKERLLRVAGLFELPEESVAARTFGMRIRLYAIAVNTKNHSTRPRPRCLSGVSNMRQKRTQSRACGADDHPFFRLSPSRISQKLVSKQTFSAPC